jgi:hypothetical protein
LGRVARGCSRRPTSTAQKKTKLKRYHSTAAVTAACLPQKNVSTDAPPTLAFLGARPREDPRRRRSSLRAEASAELEISFFHAAGRSTGLVSLRHLLSHSGLGTEQRDVRHHGGHTVEQREGLYIQRNFELAKSSAPWLSQIVLPMASSKDAHRNGAHRPKV